MLWYRIKSYIKYILSAQSGKGHGIHSPFVYAIVREVLMNKHQTLNFDVLDDYRAVLCFDKHTIEVEDCGACAKNGITVKRIKDIACTSLTIRKYSTLLYRLSEYFHPSTILELGTSLGLSGSYMALANPNAKLYTIEASVSIAEVAEQTFRNININNVELIKGRFADVLPALLPRIGKIDFAFVDGNHTKEATLYHFESLLPYVDDNSVLVFDDIYWSSGMTEAWQAIKSDSRVTLTIDVFQFGIVFFRKGMKKQNFVLRY